MCHEAGHAIGLTHGQNASPLLLNSDNSLNCMQTPDNEVLVASLGTHNIQQINAAY